MSDTQHTERVSEDLTRAVADNPEAVATFVERLDAVNELLEVLELGEAALDDEMVASIAGTTATLGEAADGVATEETVELAATVGEHGDELSDALETVLRLQRTGALEDLVELAEVASLLTAALDDEMASSLAGTGASLAELADTAADDDTRAGLETVLAAVGDAEAAGPADFGARTVYRAARDDDVQTGAGYLVVLAKALGQRVE